jgi:hypothetical protein
MTVPSNRYTLEISISTLQLVGNFCDDDLAAGVLGLAEGGERIGMLQRLVTAHAAVSNLFNPGR